jgi:hemerythrin-like domain-containing protein
MMPIGPLMIEHRLIEKVIELIRIESEKVKNGKAINVLFIDRAIDFIRIYADRTHHGKEEDILFRDLENKNLSEEDKRIMNDLINEHNIARKTVKMLEDAKVKYIAGENEQLPIILQKFDAIVSLYPNHIRKEDKIFFLSSMKYFNQEEKNKMLEEMRKFDSNMIHEKYRLVYEELKSE